MDNETWQNVKQIFLAALEKEETARTAFLDDACAGNADLRDEVESLLAANHDLSGFIEEPAFQIGGVFGTDSEPAGKQFGNYKILKEIGAGGMGAVFLAERSDGEFSQQVAIKIIRQSIADSEIVNRFKRERQILANLNHPNIARLLDGGVSASGEPFLAMEFVEGETITKYLDREKLDLEGRLRLFLKVCAAVQYAHRNLVVHRDLKPGNILVRPNGEPALLDFGLAKLVNEDMSADPTQTQTAFRALTPAYASPEQLTNRPITTASDTYSLGIVFYELLTGERPFQIEGKDLGNIVKTVTETEPPLPSESLAARPHRSKLRGDLDNITLTALRKEPARRYESVEAFADDIKRYLEGRPVSARPNTFKYRTGKFIGRHKPGMLAASLILLSLLSVVAVSIWQARIAQREKEKAEIVNEFLQSILNASNPNMNSPTAKRAGMTVKEVLDEASKRLQSDELANQPEVRAELQRIIGTSYLTQGEYDLAAQNLNAALELKTHLYGENSPETLQVLVALGELFVLQSDKENANKIYRQRLSILRTEQQRGNISADYLLAALNDFAVLRRSEGASVEAGILLQEALALRDRISPEAKNTFGLSEAIFALTLSDQGKFEDAIAIVRPKVEAIKKQDNPETPELSGNLTALGSFQMENGELDEAEKNLTDGEAIYRKLFSPGYVPLGDNLRLQAQLFYSKGDIDSAERKVNETLKIYATNPRYINYPSALIVQGLVLVRRGRQTEGEKILREALRLRLESLPKDHFWVSLAQSALGECLTTERHYEEAEPLLLESYENLKNSQGVENPRTLLAKSRLALLYEKHKYGIRNN